MTLTPLTPLTPLQIAAVALDALVHPQTVQRRLAGLANKPCTRDRIDKALVAKNLAAYIPAAAAPSIPPVCS
jgi:hypothetical protein